MNHNERLEERAPAAPLRSPSPRGRTIARAVVLVAAVVALSPGARPGDDRAESIETTRAALEQWVEVRRIISQEQRDWKLGREMLADRIELTRDQVETLRARIEETSSSITEADGKIGDLEAENRELAEASEALVGIVAKLEERTRALVGKLPAPARERVNLLVQRLPKDSAETKLSLSDRFLNIVGILNELNRFNREVTVTSEVRKLPDGSAAEVAALYVGLGHAFYVSADRLHAGIGRATASGWTWEARPDAAEAVARAIAILQEGEVAEFVGLPVSVQ